MESPFPTVLAEIEKLNHFLECWRAALARTLSTDPDFLQAQGRTLPTITEIIHQLAAEMEAQTGRMPTTIQVSPDVYTGMEQEYAGKEPVELWGMRISIIDGLPQGYIAVC